MVVIHLWKFDLNYFVWFLFFFYNKKHIRAKLLIPKDLEIATTKDGKPLKAIMPSGSNKYGTVDKYNTNFGAQTTEMLNDFDIDITHIEKYVQDSDSIVMDQK